MPEDDDASFMLIEDEDDTPPMEAAPPVKAAKPAPAEKGPSIIDDIRSRLGELRLPEKKVEAEPEPKPAADAEPIFEAEMVDIGLVADGVHGFCWNLNGMDCPDCAMKATKALKRLPGIENVRVSAAEGTVRFDQDISLSAPSRAASILTSLGHDADLPWQEIEGATATGLAAIHNTKRGAIRRMMLQVPGIIGCRTEDARILIQIVDEMSHEMRQEMEGGLEKMLGRPAKLRTVANDRLTPSQMRLVLTIPALLLLLIIIAFESKLGTPVVMAMTLLGVGLSGWRMFAEAAAGLANRQFGFQLLTSLAVIGALANGDGVEALLVSILVAVAAHMENAAMRKARDAMQGGLDRLPRRARLAEKAVTAASIGTISIGGAAPTAPVASASGHSHADDDMVPIELVQPGDRIEVRSGELMPVDGIVVEGIGSLNRAPLTGESIPVRITDGDEVQAGLSLERGPVIVEARSVGGETRLAGLIEEVRTFRDQPPRVQKTIEVFTTVWVPIVLVGAVLTGLIFAEPGEGFNVQLMLLLWVVACPCALLLAAPVPHSAALSAAARSGVIARGGDALEAAASVDLALLDKTGTLTTGKPRLGEVSVGIGVDRNRVLRLAAGIEQRSNHPYASVILAHAEEKGAKAFAVTGIRDGEKGVMGKMRGKPIHFGRPAWLEDEGVEIPTEIEGAIAAADTQGYGCSVLSEDGIAIAAFTFIHDDLREGAAEMVHDLQAQGVAVELLSGDAQAAVELLGRRLGLSAAHCRGDIDPEGKAAWVMARSAGRRTLMAGDGFNDAAALAAADLGIAVGSGEQVNLEAADVLIPGEDPRAISTLIKLARRTKLVVKANLLLSVLITVILVIGAVMEFQSRLDVAVAIHEASAFIVILNGAFVAVSGSRFGLVLDVLRELWNDYVVAVKLALGRTAPES